MVEKERRENMIIIEVFNDNVKLKKGFLSVKEERKFFAVKREKISVQFKISSEQRVVVENFNVLTEPFAVPHELYVEEYLSFEKASNQFLTPGVYPDAILPFEFALQNGFTTIEAHDERSFLLQMTIPEELKAGDYRSIVQFLIDGKNYETSFNLHVYDITLPEQNNCKTLFSIFKDGDWLTGTEEEKYEQYKADYELLANYRISGTYLPTKSIELDKAKIKDVIEAAKTYANDKRIACYSLNYKGKIEDIGGKKFAVLDREYFKALLVALVENSTDECNLLHNCALYLGSIVDEPTPEQFPKVRRAYDDVYQIKREVANELDFTGKREVERSLLTFDNILTVFHKEPIYGGVDTWCPTFWGYSFPEYRYEAKQLAHLGFKHWFYGCFHPQTPFPVYMIDEQLHQIKAVNWMMFDYNIDGNLYWAVNCCYRKTEEYYNNPVDGNEIFPQYHGDGYLLYHKEVYGKHVASLRLNAIMEGNQDYEKLLIYRERVQQIALDYAISFDCKSILRPYLDKIYEGTIVSENVDSVFEAERALNELIELADMSILFEKGSVKDGITEISVYLPERGRIHTTLVPSAEKKLCGGVKLTYKVPMNQKKNFFLFAVDEKEYALFIGDKVKTIALDKLQAKGDKVTVQPYGKTSSMIVKTLPFLNSEKEATEFVYEYPFDATSLDRLYFELESLCDFECIISADLIDQNGKAFELGYEMLEERKCCSFSIKKQWRVIKNLNNADDMIEGYRNREKYEEHFRSFDFKHVVAIRFNVLNNTKMLDDNRERRTPKYTFIINSVYYSEGYEETI